MKTLLILALAIMATLSPVTARALAVDVPPPAGFQIITDTATILNVSVATHQFTSMGTLAGGNYALIQSTDVTAGFCCSMESSATAAAAVGAVGCIRAKKEPGGGFYELEIKRWARDLTIRCQSLYTVSARTLVILQGR